MEQVFSFVRKAFRLDEPCVLISDSLFHGLVKIKAVQPGKMLALGKMRQVRCRTKDPAADFLHWFLLMGRSNLLLTPANNSTFDRRVSSNLSIRQPAVCRENLTKARSARGCAGWWLALEMREVSRLSR